MDLATLLANNGNIPAPATPKAPKGRKVRKPKAKPFAAPMTPQDAQAQVNSQANMRYGSQYGALGAQLQDVGQRQQQVPAWFANYKAELAARNAANKARYDAAITQVNQQGAAQQAASNAQTDQQQAAAQADAASRGATAGAQPFADARTGTTNTGALQTAFAALLGTQSQAQQDYGSNMQSVAGLTEQNAAGTLGRERAGLLGQGRTLDAEQAAFKTGAYGDLRNQERTYGLARAAYGLKEQTAVQTAYDKAAARRVSRANTRDRIAASQQTALPKPKKADVKIASQIRTGVQLVKHHDNGLDTYWGNAFNTLVQTDRLDPVIARAIVQGARVGRVGPKTAQTLLRDYGLTLADLGLDKPRGRVKPYSPPVTSRPDAAQP